VSLLRRLRRRSPEPATGTTHAADASSGTPESEAGVREAGTPGSEAEDVAGMFLIVGLGNPGSRYAKTRHNVGFEIAAELSRRWELPRAKERFRGRIAEGRTRPGGPRVAILVPHTYMNESGDSAGPARGQLRTELDHVIAVHDEIDLPFGEVRSKLGGGVAGHNGLKSLKRGLGSGDFWRVRAGVGRPDSTDPEIVSAHVLGRFSESDDEVRALIAAAADETERLVERIGAADDG
jgi:peptidyl-tRNA hydrolase, PTH1 family